MKIETFNSFNEKKKKYVLQKYQRSNQDTLIFQRPLVREGEWIQSGDLVADCSTSLGGELSLGKNIFIAYMPWEGYNYEDAILISERLVNEDVYTSIHIESYEVETRMTKFGKEKFTKHIPDVPESQTEHLDQRGIVKIGTSVKEGDILVGKVTPIQKKFQSPYEKLLYTILEKELLPMRASSLRTPKGYKAKVLEMKILSFSSRLDRKEQTNLTSFNISEKSPVFSQTQRNFSKKTLFQSPFFSGPFHFQNFSLFNRFVLFSSFFSKKMKTGTKFFHFSGKSLQDFGAQERMNEKKSFFEQTNGRKKFEFFFKSFQSDFSSPLKLLSIKGQMKEHEPFFETETRPSKKQKFYFPIFLDPQSQKIHFFSALLDGFGQKQSFPSFSNGFSKKQMNLFWAQSSAKQKQQNNGFNFSGNVSGLNSLFSGGQKKENSSSSSLEQRNDSSLEFSGLFSPEYGTKKKKLVTFFSGQTFEKVSKENGGRNSEVSKKDVEKKNPFSSAQSFSIREKTEKIPEKVQIYLVEKRRIQVGDKMSGRHGNKGIVSQILPIPDMPFLPDGTPLDMVLNPLGVPSRMNVGQIYECILGLASKYLQQYYRIQPFDEIYGPQASRSFTFSKLYEARKKTSQKWLFNPCFPGKMYIFDGRTGEPYENPVTVGISYILKLVHLVDDKIHARSTGPYSLVTQQPLRGRSKYGGQRLGEMEVWAIEAYGAAFILLEMLTIKSDDISGRMTLWSNILLNMPIYIGTPESFKVLVCELQALCLDMGLYRFNKKGFLTQIEHLMQLP